jgi:chemotaxis signal transduction protein
MSTSDTYLIFRAAGHVCAISTEHVDETMRPMRLTPIDNAPSFVAGLSVIRGMAYPVLDLRKFFQGDGVDAPK